MVSVPEPNFELITATSVAGKRLFIVVMNDKNEVLESSIMLDLAKLKPGLKVKDVILANGEKSLGRTNKWKVSLIPYGLQVYTVEFE